MQFSRKPPKKLSCSRKKIEAKLKSPINASQCIVRPIVKYINKPWCMHTDRQTATHTPSDMKKRIRRFSTLFLPLPWQKSCRSEKATWEKSEFDKMKIFLQSPPALKLQPRPVRTAFCAPRLGMKRGFLQNMQFSLLRIGWWCVH